jgi:hypothetical protein
LNRDLRVTRDPAGWPRRRVAGGPPAPSSADFARGILRRYGGRRGVRRPLDRIFRRSAAIAAFAGSYHRHEHWLGLRLERQLLPVLRERSVLRTSLFWRVAPPVSVQPATPRPAFVERIFARERRTESTVTIRSLVERVVGARRAGRQGSEPIAARPEPAPAIPMIVRKPAAPPALPERPAAPAAERFTAEPWATPRPRARGPLAAADAIPLSPVQINRLTDQVVDAIDRRFTAYRERRGRI